MSMWANFNESANLAGKSAFHESFYQRKTPQKWFDTFFLYSSLFHCLPLFSNYLHRSMQIEIHSRFAILVCGCCFWSIVAPNWLQPSLLRTFFFAWAMKSFWVGTDECLSTTTNCFCIDRIGVEKEWKI